MHSPFEHSIHFKGHRMQFPDTYSKPAMHPVQIVGLLASHELPQADTHFTHFPLFVREYSLSHSKQTPF